MCCIYSVDGFRIFSPAPRDTEPPPPPPPKQDGDRISNQFLCHIWKKRNERSNVGGVSISRKGAPYQKGCVVNGQMTLLRQATNEYAPPHPSPPVGLRFMYAFVFTVRRIHHFIPWSCTHHARRFFCLSISVEANLPRGSGGLKRGKQTLPYVAVTIVRGLTTPHP